MRNIPLSFKKAFSLVEVVLALGLISFCLIVLLALLPISLSTIKNATDETGAANAVTTVIADLNATPSSTQFSTTYNLKLPTISYTNSLSESIYLDPEGKLVATANSAGAKYRVAVTISNLSQQNTATGLAAISWPSQSTSPRQTVEVFFTVNR